MSRRKRYSSGTATATMAPGISLRGRSARGETFWETLTKPRGAAPKMKHHEMTFVLQNLSALVGNGVSLPKALATLAKEDTLSKHRAVLDSLRRKVEGGAPFSTALGAFPQLCDKITLSQIRVGERAGTLVGTLKHLADTQNKSRELRRQVTKKLAYPALLCVMGSGLVTFLLLHVVPVFEKTYADANVELPAITEGLIFVGWLARTYLGWVAALVVAAVAAMRQARKNNRIAERIDRAILRAPLFGRWLRDMAVLQVMDVLHNLMTAGFTLADALRETADAVSNRAVRQSVRNLQRAVQRGERFSRELERQEDVFPPIVNQLVLVGESTGKLTGATSDICDHLRREIERKTSLLVGALEPVLTISLAVAIAVILLAIYLPIFDMVNTVS